jgi:hypothetical protein
MSSSPRWLAAVGGSLLAHAALIAAAIAWVAIYSYLIAPDKDVSAYQAHARQSGPWVSLVVGMPLFYFLCRWIGRQAPARARATIWALLAIYLALDLTLLVALARGELPMMMIVANYLAKVMAGLAGARAATATVAAANPDA